MLFELLVTPYSLLPKLGYNIIHHWKVLIGKNKQKRKRKKEHKRGKSVNEVTKKDKHKLNKYQRSTNTRNLVTKKFNDLVFITLNSLQIIFCSKYQTVAVEQRKTTIYIFLALLLYLALTFVFLLEGQFFVTRNTALSRVSAKCIFVFTISEFAFAEIIIILRIRLNIFLKDMKEYTFITFIKIINMFIT
ncbi:hypothetical protein RFI_07789 [Reticulomyxa filosa]|uniref:Uncharacterized protein n=1 Tax=Reticulomyxa filosa TaxID=46433 RepID=X6NTQ3_RETFI|nr:hypothetical protein RFI_07789 [Reticulomyxa filosa]|eukprot:ETO29333.1 hypothetical protein RFI_07789 [Reticulomyxa filosa]